MPESTNFSAAAAAVGLASEPKWLWTCGGACFGYRSGNSLHTHDGLEVGRFDGNEIYGPDGSYLGELSGPDAGARLITNCYKRSLTGKAFIPGTSRGYDLPDRQIARPIYSGHEDFPSLDIVRARCFSAGMSPRRLRT